MTEVSSLNPESSTQKQSKKILNLQDNCVLSINLFVKNSNLQSITSTSGEIARIVNYNSSESELESLKRENELLRAALKDKDEIIGMLKQQIEKN